MSVPVFIYVNISCCVAKKKGYIFGAPGGIERDLGLIALRGWNPIREEMVPQPQYRVVFLMKDLWHLGDHTDHDTVTVEIFDEWLEEDTSDVLAKKQQEHHHHEHAHSHDGHS